MHPEDYLDRLLLYIQINLSILLRGCVPLLCSRRYGGCKLHNLHLFANAVEKSRPDPNDPDVIYFGPGVHQPKDTPGDAYNIPSGKTVYIAGGAVVRAKLVCDNVNNVKIIGRGILDQPV